jgi:hypothetical protein
MIPAFNEFGVLPPGVHLCNLEEFRERFETYQGSGRRFRIFEKLEKLVHDVSSSSCVRRLILGGSFVSAKDAPNDFDCILVLDSSIIGEELRPSDYNLVSRKRARSLYGGDVIPLVEGSEALDWYIEFFQTTRDGHITGLVEIEL